MARAKKHVEPDGTESISFTCPGCAAGGGIQGYEGPRADHKVPVTGSKAWGFNGSIERPTLTPSILTSQRWGYEERDRVCHSFVTDGRIQFLGDCTHALAGQTVELAEVVLEAP
jgi:hypothetical protein